MRRTGLLSGAVGLWRGKEELVGTVPLKALKSTVVQAPVS